MHPGVVLLPGPASRLMPSSYCLVSPMTLRRCRQQQEQQQKLYGAVKPLWVSCQHDVGKHGVHFFAAVLRKCSLKQRWSGGRVPNYSISFIYRGRMPARQTLDLSFFHSNQAESVWQENLRETVLGPLRPRPLLRSSLPSFSGIACVEASHSWARNELFQHSIKNSTKS